MRKLLFVLFAVSLVAGVGCGRKKESTKSGSFLANKLAEKIAERAIEKDSGGKANVSIENGKISVKTDKGAMQIATGDGVELPKDFPKDIPIYADAKIMQVITTPQGAHIMLQSADAQAKVVAFYREHFEGAGWKSEMEMKNSGNDMLSYSKEQRKVTLMASRQDDKTVLSLTTE